MRALVVALLALLPACSSAPLTAEPGVAVVWYRVEEPHAACESLSARKNFFNILGCSHRQEPAVQGGPRVCSIYAPAPRNERDLQRFATLGHELVHCIDGNWHDKWGRMNTAPRVAGAGGAGAAAGGTAQ